MPLPQDPLHHLDHQVQVHLHHMDCQVQQVMMYVAAATHIMCIVKSSTVRMQFRRRMYNETEYLILLKYYKVYLYIQPTLSAITEVASTCTHAKMLLSVTPQLPPQSAPQRHPQLCPKPLPQLPRPVTLTSQLLSPWVWWSYSSSLVWLYW